MAGISVLGWQELVEAESSDGVDSESIHDNRYTDNHDDNVVNKEREVCLQPWS